MNAGTPEAFLKEMPAVTRAVLVATFCVTLSSVLSLFNVELLLLDWLLVLRRFHVWRLFTDYLFVGPFSFGWLFHMYFFTTFSSKLERHPAFLDTRRPNSKGGYLYFLVLQMLALDVLSLLFFPPTGRPLLGPSLSYAVIYYWSRKEPIAPVSLWGFSMQAWQFPYGLLLLDVLMGQSIYGDLMGLATGHMYHFIRDVLPIERNIDLLKSVPEIFATLTDKLDFMASNRGTAAQVHYVGAGHVQTRASGLFSGVGRTTGRTTQGAAD